MYNMFAVGIWKTIYVYPQGQNNTKNSQNKLENFRDFTCVYSFSLKCVSVVETICTCVSYIHTWLTFKKFSTCLSLVSDRNC